MTLAPVPPTIDARPHAPEADVAELLASLPRADQRRRGREYVQGLLDTAGRRSIRRVAATVAGEADGRRVRAVEQQLHHFVCDSTWDWAPVRRALAAHGATAVAPQARVVRRAVLPRTGDRAVGTCRRFEPRLGRAVTAQIGVGLWEAGDERAVPVDWILHLPEDGRLEQDVVAAATLPDTTPRPGAGVRRLRTARPGNAEPAGAPSATLPVLLDGRDLDTGSIVAGLVAAERPAVVRVAPELALTPLAHGACPEAPAGRLLATARRRRPVAGPDGPVMATAVDVALRGPAGPLGPMRLVGLAGDRTGPARIWLITHPDAWSGAADLARITALPARVAREAAAAGETAGLGDFTGRSFAGWHRHVTLASIAHVVRDAARPTPAPADRPRDQAG